VSSAIIISNLYAINIEQTPDYSPKKEKTAIPKKLQSDDVASKLYGRSLFQAISLEKVGLSASIFFAALPQKRISAAIPNAGKRFTGF
jgi:hypothetical protein